MVTLESISPENLNDISGEEQKLETMEKEDSQDYEDKISEYELTREERIRENRERMQKLGICDLSQKLSALKPTPKRAYHRRNPRNDSPLPPSGPVRRSSRLQNSTPISYCEVQVAKKEKSLNDDDILRAEGSRPEVYTEEHEKLLGSSEMSWTLFVDGYGKDGKRIYDPVKGKTCHQCRQKTLGHRTHCNKCSMVQGQFCGDCLYMRYGENVLEAKANLNWICPVCRGICNCSLCRQAKGWPPTGVLYKKISSLGYKSVAHYLMQTRRSATNSDTNSGSKVLVSAKRSLPFSDIEVAWKEDDLSKPNSDPLSVSGKEFDNQKMVPENGDEPLLDAGIATPTRDLLKEDDLSKPNSESLNPDPLSVSGKEFGNQKMAPENGTEPLLNPAIATPTKDLLDYPLKLEPAENGACHDEDQETEFLVNGEPDKSSMEPKTVKEQMAARESLDDPFIIDSGNHHKDNGSIPETMGRGDDYEIKKEKCVVDKKDVNELKKNPKSTKKRVGCDPPADSIAGRLRQRRNKGCALD